MGLFEVVTGAVAGLFGGAVGGVLTAGQISRRSELAREQLGAERALRELIERYRATIVFDHNQVFEASKFSKDYASITGQEEFAIAVLAHVEPLGERTVQDLRSEVLELVGDLRLRLAEQRTWLPVEQLDPEREGKRQSLALYQIRHSGDERVYGLLPNLLKSQNDPNQHEVLYQATLASLDRMLNTLAKGRRARR